MGVCVCEIDSVFKRVFPSRDFVLILISIRRFLQSESNLQRKEGSDVEFL